MSQISLTQRLPSQVLTPPAGKFALFINANDGSLSIKDSAGQVISTSDALDVESVYETTYSETGGNTSVYTVDLTSRVAPQLGRSFLIRIPSTNAFGEINISIPGVGNYALSKGIDIPFADQELKSGQIIGVVLTSTGDAYFTQGFSNIRIIDTDLASLKTAISNSELVEGFFYRFPFTTTYISNGSIVNSSLGETLIVRAVDDNQIDRQVRSLDFPNDIIYMNLFEPTYGAKIIRRVDTVKNLDAPYDWRNVKFRRGADVDTGLPIIADINDDSFISTPVDVYTFDNSRDGGTCRNIKIDPAQINKSNTAIADLLDYNIDDLNNVFYDIQNLHVTGTSYFNSFVNEKDNSVLSNNPVSNASSFIGSSSQILAVNFEGCVINTCDGIEIRGSRINGDQKYTAHGLTLNSVVDAKLIDVNLTNIRECEDIRIEGSSRINLENSSLVYITTSHRTNIVTSTRCAAINSDGVRISRVTNVNLVNSDDSTLLRCQNLLLENSSNHELTGLVGAFEPAAVEGIIINSNVAASSVLLTAEIPNTPLTDGLTFEINDPTLTEFDRPVSINFDTNFDGTPDTTSYTITRFGSTDYKKGSNNPFYLVYSLAAGGFFLLFTDANKTPFKISGQNGIKFDGVSSNISRQFNQLGSTLSLVTSDRDFSCVGDILLQHSSGQTVSSIPSSSVSFKGLKRRIKGVSTGTLVFSGIPDSSQVPLPITLDSLNDFVVLGHNNNAFIIEQAYVRNGTGGTPAPTLTQSNLTMTASGGASLSTLVGVLQNLGKLRRLKFKAIVNSTLSTSASLGGVPAMDVSAISSKSIGKWIARNTSTNNTITGIAVIEPTDPTRVHLYRENTSALGARSIQWIDIQNLELEIDIDYLSV